MIKVLIVDDENILAHSLSRVISLEDDITVTGCASDVEEALTMCKETKPDVVIMDLFMPDVCGIEGTIKVKEWDAMIKVLMMTGSDRADMITRAMNAGVDSFVRKTLIPETLAHVIRTTHNGMRVFDESIMASILAHVPSPGALNCDEISLTDREKTVLKLVVAGKENKEIAETINLSEGSVRNVVSELLRKFDVKNRVNLVIKAISTGILESQ